MNKDFDRPMAELYEVAPGWEAVTQDSRDFAYADFERTLYRADDAVQTSVDMRVTFDTENRTASAMLLRRDDTGKDLPILMTWPVGWHAALQMIGASPRPGVEISMPYTVVGFMSRTGGLVCEHLLASSGLNAFARAAATDGMEMVAALAGRFTENDLLTFPGEGVVDSETIRDQPEVFGPVPEEGAEDRLPGAGAPRP